MTPPPLLDLQLSVSHAYAVEKREEDGFSEELGIGTVDIFHICKATGLQPPVFDIDAQHFMVTVYRPEFDEQGNRVPIASGEIKANASEVGQKTTEVGQKTTEVGAETPEVGAETAGSRSENRRKSVRKPRKSVRKPRKSVRNLILML